MKSCPQCHLIFPSEFSVCPQDRTELRGEAVWRPGDVLGGKLRIVEAIDQGSAGPVFKAERLDSGETRALRLFVTPAAHEKIVVRYLLEAVRSVREFDHPGAVRLEDVHHAEREGIFLVMEYVPGKSLGHIHREVGLLPVPHLLELVRQLCLVLEAAHALDLIHGNITPGNLLLVAQPSGRDLVKVLDFGLAKFRKGVAEHGIDAGGVTRTKAGFVFGTPQYMSPEQAMGKGGPPLDGRSDLYSAGVLMYEALTGELPFHGHTPQGFLLHHIHTRPVSPQKRRPDLKLTEPVVDVVMKALEKDPTLRFQSGLEMALALEEAEESIERETKISKAAPRRQSGVDSPPRFSARTEAPVASESGSFRQDSPPPADRGRASPGSGSGALQQAAVGGPTGGRANPPSGLASPDAGSVTAAAEPPVSQVVAEDPKITEGLVAGSQGEPAVRFSRAELTKGQTDQRIGRAPASSLPAAQSTKVPAERTPERVSAPAVPGPPSVSIPAARADEALDKSPASSLPTAATPKAARPSERAPLPSAPVVPISAARADRPTSRVSLQGPSGPPTVGSWPEPLPSRKTPPELAKAPVPKILVEPLAGSWPEPLPSRKTLPEPARAPVPKIPVEPLATMLPAVTVNPALSVFEALMADRPAKRNVSVPLIAAAVVVVSLGLWVTVHEIRRLRSQLAPITNNQLNGGGLGDGVAATAPLSPPPTSAPTTLSPPMATVSSPPAVRPARPRVTSSQSPPKLSASGPAAPARRVEAGAAPRGNVVRTGVQASKPASAAPGPRRELSPAEEAELKDKLVVAGFLMDRGDYLAALDTFTAALKIDAANLEAQAGARRARQARGAQKNNARP